MEKELFRCPRARLCSSGNCNHKNIHAKRERCVNAYCNRFEEEDCTCIIASGIQLADELLKSK